MRNLKEIKAILTAIYCINQTGTNDEDIGLICQYAFDRILNSNTNMLTLCCAGFTKVGVMPEIEKLLEEETNYIKFKEIKNAHKRQ
ncbi:MAG: hypothetical protein IJ458_01285 [Clostridia bacterium]|nr:hypothetical protein [bacterium]MBQ8426087.1 hypothetical protein [Clostridia bacterium]MBQ8522280.1 hypothetical protein [Clostridia bacterium]